MRVSLAELAPLLGGDVVGDGQTLIERVAPLEQAQPGDLTFVAEDRHLARLAHSHASAVLVAPHMPVDRPALRVLDPYLGFIQLLEYFAPLQHPAWGRAVQAVIAPDVVLGQDINIGPYVVIEHGSRLGDGVVVYPGTYIGPACDIGAGSVLYANVSLYARVSLGCRVIVHSGAVIGADGFGFHPLADGSYRKIPQVGRVMIGDGVEIGANTCIDRATVGDTVIEAGVKLDNLVQVGHNSVIGAHTVVAGQAGVAGSVRIGTGVRMGGQVGVTDHVTIGDHAAIMAQSGVAADVAPGAVVFGSPATSAPLAKRTYVYTMRLQALFHQVKDLQRRLEALERQEKKA